MLPVQGSQQMNNLSWSQSLITYLNDMKILKFCLKCEVDLRAASGVSTVLIIVAVVAVCAAHLLGALEDNLSLGDEPLGVFHLPDEAVDWKPGLDTGAGHDQDQHSCYKI